MNWIVPLTDVTVGEEELQAVAEVLRSGWLTQGPRVEAFERAFAGALGVPHAVAVANGTAALHLAYAAAGLGPEDEFIIPALTFVATMNAGIYLGAKPVLADCISADDLTVSPGDVARKITPRTRLIVTMPYGGFSPDMTALVHLANEHGIPLVEDAAHAPLATFKGRALGTFGAAGAFSFFGNKNLTTGEGGMVVSADDTLAAHIRRMRSHGMTTLTWERHQGHAADYDVMEPGYNYRMDEVRAALGIEQLKKLPDANLKRAENARLLREAIESLEIPGLTVPFSSPRGTPAHHLFVLLLPQGTDRAAFRKRMSRAGIQTSVHYPLLSSFSLWRSYFGSGKSPSLPVALSVADRLVTLPMGPHLNPKSIEMIAQALKECLNVEKTNLKQDEL